MTEAIAKPFLAVSFKVSHDLSILHFLQDHLERHCGLLNTLAEDQERAKQPVNFRLTLVIETAVHLGPEQFATAREMIAQEASDIAQCCIIRQATLLERADHLL